jgi:hypothetical protein
MEDGSFFSMYNFQSDKYSYFFQVTDSKKKNSMSAEDPPKLPSLRGLIFCRIYMKNARLCCCVSSLLFNATPSTKSNISCAYVASVLYACTLSQGKDVLALHVNMYC